ncbi:arginyl-tRNA synthetase [Gammaproteobacteria bacterium]|nr:arginyl-tRNA synthetase [Gammaproteobacteria bacterium]
MKNILIQLLQNALAKINVSATEKIASSLERTRDQAHGDFASNIAMMLAKSLNTNPRALAQTIIEHLPKHLLLEKVEIAGPGFLNFTLNKVAYHQELAKVIKEGSSYGHSNIGHGAQVQIEFVSANPTGPLHVGHGRGAAIGDSLARLLIATGFNVTKEFYYNDAGAQINNLTASTKARIDGLNPTHPNWQDSYYRGEYIADIAKSFLNKETVIADDRSITATGDKDDLESIRDFSVAYLRREQDLDLKAFGVKFDVFFLESSLYATKKVEQVVSRLTQRGYTYEQDAALWLKSTDFGDDKDRVMRKSDGSYTYFVPDVAYHLSKWERGFVRVINEQGADHHGTISRVRAGLQALEMDIPKHWPDYVLHQMVMVLKNGEEVKLAKRAGDYVTLRDLIDDVGKDATRFFLVARKPDSQLQFDIDLARSQGNDNPVYYIHYAHARICSVLRERENQSNLTLDTHNLSSLGLLNLPHEYDLMRLISRFSEMIIIASNNNSPHLIAAYLQDLAASVHAYYNIVDATGTKIKILTKDINCLDAQALQDAKIFLISAAKQVLANGLDLLGLSAPERM